MATAIEAPASIPAEGPTSHTLMQLDGLAKLREPFPAEQIHPLPKITCPACSQSRTKVCDNPRHQKSKCRECDNFITSAHLHLDYVGHAELTNRLLDADPLWDWEPLALDQRGLPQFDENGGLWIRLTVCGKTRLGYGDAQGKRGPNAIKEAIGDALRNAAMRFGAALDLWAKSDLREATAEHPKSAEDDGVPAAPRPDLPPTPEQAQQAALTEFQPKVRNGWNSLTAMEQNLAEARAKNLTDLVVPAGADEVPTRLEDLLTERITQLKTAADGGAQGRSAA
ncbi:hypothetical protein [Streptomyces fradiae]|uniref:hypothetical protein n=1 Tax=Streptomyces fradiae TaxID=1906 RepID=UPI0036F6BB36